MKMAMRGAMTMTVARIAIEVTRLSVRVRICDRNLKASVLTKIS
jgi:hypothetical protein